MIAKTEYIFLDPLQRRGKCNALYRTPRERRFSEFLQSLVQLHTFQLLALLKCAWLDVLNARREDDLFEATLTKTTIPDSLEAIRKLDISQARAFPERPTANLLQRASRPENYLFQTLAFLEGTIRNLHDAARNDHALYSGTAERQGSYLLQLASILEHDFC